jgi:acyl-CoA synthetase (NDP forming)
MGICNPDIEFYCMAPHVRPKYGTTSLIAQSGNLGTQILAFAANEDIGIRAFSGSGNEAMITIEDYLHCLEVDELTRTVVLYLESIKDGRRFFELARRVGHKKPVIVLKGGRTEAGSRAAASHTGAMASNTKIFNAACRQAGVVLAEQPMDLLDLSAAFSSMPLPADHRVAIMTLGGGWGVVATDLCAESGMIVPHLSQDIIAKIDKILPPYWSRSNPIDIVGELDPQISMLVMEELAKWDGCDAIIHLGCVGRMLFVRKTIESALATDPNQSPQIEDFVISQMVEYEKKFTEFTVQLMETYHKPIVGVYLLADETNRMIRDVEGRRYKGVTFQSPERAVKALARMYEYQSWLKLDDRQNQMQ